MNYKEIRQNLIWEHDNHFQEIPNIKPKELSTIMHHLNEGNFKFAEYKNRYWINLLKQEIKFRSENQEENNYIADLMEDLNNY